MTSRNGASNRRGRRILVAIVLLTFLALLGLVLVGSYEDFDVGQPAPSPSLVTEEDDGSQDGFGRPLSDTGESLPNLDDENSPVTDMPGAAERVEDDERQ